MQFSIFFFEILFLHIRLFTLFFLSIMPWIDKLILKTKFLIKNKLKEKKSFRSKRSHVKIDLVMKKAISTKIKLKKNKNFTGYNWRQFRQKCQQLSKFLLTIVLSIVLSKFEGVLSIALSKFSVSGKTE